jgi:hypothetical protein
MATKVDPKLIGGIILCAGGGYFVVRSALNLRATGCLPDLYKAVGGTAAVIGGWMWIRMVNKQKVTTGQEKVLEKVKEELSKEE